MTKNLIVAPPGKEPVLYELNASRIGLGRSPDNQIRIEEDCISYSHAELFQEDGDDYMLRDLDSKNGTRINGLMVRVHSLQDGDRILLSETVPCYFVELDGADEPEPAVTTPEPGKGKEAVAIYAGLQDKVHDLERKLKKVRADFKTKKAEHDKLSQSIAELQQRIEEETSGGADESTLEELQKDLLHKTQKVNVLKSDLDGARGKIETLEATRKVALKAPGPDGPKKPVPVPPASLPPAAPPRKPGGGPVLPAKTAAPKKPPTAADLPPVKPKKPGQG